MRIVPRLRGVRALSVKRAVGHFLDRRLGVPFAAIAQSLSSCPRLVVLYTEPPTHSPGVFDPDAAGHAAAHEEAVFLDLNLALGQAIDPTRYRRFGSRADLKFYRPLVRSVGPPLVEFVLNTHMSCIRDPGDLPRFEADNLPNLETAEFSSGVFNTFIPPLTNLRPPLRRPRLSYDLRDPEGRLGALLRACPSIDHLELVSEDMKKYEVF
ncbi:hypothetical protein BDK51DRAFT_40162 [Blyttiomyces helicus]|uniref:Uncharacterized protein n=1 Tax=Blyttiomyces helicus TaxID=388810 RepID=A0A4P9VX58_9FUNG|nr:hypothetical protein BDK51DRAFT_40162 [Blyttiomyces helicus]|eukprot:RKO83283.1 hypothetical protein BDK51DRAFT_40162 [Blyttiomyces helicus]